MDTSEQYIKMCDCEIQKDMDRDTIDWRKQGYCKKHECLLVEDMDGSPSCPIGELKRDYSCNYKHWIALLYQDQLQEMLIEEGYRQWSVQLDAVRAWYINDTNFPVYDSMEQLWLAFVMHELYNESWNGEEWMKD